MFSVIYTIIDRRLCSGIARHCLPVPTKASLSPRGLLYIFFKTRTVGPICVSDWEPQILITAMAFSEWAIADHLADSDSLRMPYSSSLAVSEYVFDLLQSFIQSLRLSRWEMKRIRRSETIDRFRRHNFFKELFIYKQVIYYSLNSPLFIYNIWFVCRFVISFLYFLIQWSKVYHFFLFFFFASLLQLLSADVNRLADILVVRLTTCQSCASDSIDCHQYLPNGCDGRYCYQYCLQNCDQYHGLRIPSCVHT